MIFMGLLLGLCVVTLMWLGTRVLAERDESARSRIDCLRTEVFSLRNELNELRDSLQDKHPASAFRAPPEGLSALRRPSASSEDGSAEAVASTVAARSGPTR